MITDKSLEKLLSIVQEAEKKFLDTSKGFFIATQYHTLRDDRYYPMNRIVVQAKNIEEAIKLAFDDLGISPLDDEESFEDYFNDNCQIMPIERENLVCVKVDDVDGQDLPGFVDFVYMEYDVEPLNEVLQSPSRLKFMQLIYETPEIDVSSYCLQ